MLGLGAESCICGTTSQAEYLSVRGSFSYRKLPQQHLTLSVLKLDGSCWEIQVPKGASVAELKEAVVEAVRRTQRERQAKIMHECC